MSSSLLLLVHQGVLVYLSQVVSRLEGLGPLPPAAFPVTVPPSSAPVLAPAPKSKTKAPTNSNLRKSQPPSLQPTVAPVFAPALQPTTASKCDIPKLAGDWENFEAYPMPIAEAQGTIIGDDLVIISGFTGGYEKATNKNYAINLKDEKPKWRKIANLPIKEGITHGAFALVGSKLHMCGGYLGGHPGPHISDCLVYDHANDVWSDFEPLPEGRAGGGLVYSSQAHALIFAAGAERPEPDVADAVDYQHTWMYSFDKPSAGWVEKDDIPYLTNHMSYATAFDQAGNEHQLFFAGQVGENEYTGNVDDNFEWNVATEAWIRKKAMPFTRGHASSSTSAVNCGLVVAGGSSNEFGIMADISFYDILSDKWTSIGSLPAAINTPVCAIDQDGGWYYCVTGWADGIFSSRIKIEV